MIGEYKDKLAEIQRLRREARQGIDDAVTAAVAAERARCAAVCREVAAQAVGPLALDAGVRRGATTCAEAIERGAVTP